MKISSARLGDLEISEQDVIVIPDGIIGFPGYTNFAELHFLEGSPLRLLQSLEARDLAFFVIDPFLFKPDYRINISTADLAVVKSETPEGLRILTIVTIPEDPYEMTANLQGPLIVNPATQLSTQVVNHDKDYTTKHRILSSSQTEPVAI
ncbi:MAG: flagellar assembly protein FliW [Nitrospinae bacterium]|nr:flagellar assembly protein FliW [Nitrospinota bacterium]MBF0633397.1 flagellar assembly protein FliW [Nitrospinota bacterium]